MLKDYCIGDSVEYISVEYAKSGRSACRTCKQKIGSDQLRIGILVDDDHFSTGQGTMWYHKLCFHFKPRHGVLDSNELKKKIHNYQHLKKKDQKDVLEYLKSQLEAIKESKNKRKAPSKSKSKGKTTKTKNQEPKVQVKNVNVRTTRSSNRAEKKEPQIEPQSKVVKIPKAKAVKLRKQAPKKFLTPAQINRYKEFTEEYNNLSTDKLKEILQKNQQPKTGSKSELVAKCADGKQFGRIPTCSKCGGGRLRFNREKGTYTCPGYMEDTDFVHCSATYNFEDVKRLEWNE